MVRGTMTHAFLEWQSYAGCGGGSGMGGVFIKG